MLYDDVNYAQGRLNGTYVRYGDDLVYVADVARIGGKLVAIIMAGGEQGDAPKEVDLADLDIRAFHIGYVNYNKGATYFYRKPMREDWRQGFRDHNTLSSRGWRFKHIPKKNFRDCIKNVYPDINKSLVKAQREGINVAFHKKFAIQPDAKIEYRGKYLVGSYVDKKIDLFANYNHLNEFLKEAING